MSAIIDLTGLSQYHSTLKKAVQKPAGAFDTLAELQTAYPTGTTGVYVVKADWKFYEWSGSAWVAGGDYINDGTVVNDETYIRYEDGTALGLLRVEPYDPHTGILRIYYPNMLHLDYNEHTGMLHMYALVN